jgi:hypothetical protein
MLYVAIALFALAAVLGLLILLKWLNNGTASRAVVYSHGAVAAVALVLLIVYTLQNQTNMLIGTVAAFVVVALVGFYMFILDLQGKNAPMPIAWLHAAVAVGTFVVLLMAAFG